MDENTNLKTMKQLLGKEKIIMMKGKLGQQERERK